MPSEGISGGDLMKKSSTSLSLWGEGIPYSQAYITKEIRIFADDVSRTFFYVHADINPATYEVLKANRKKIKNRDILTFLDEAEPGRDDGYSWTVLCSQTSSWEEAEEFAEKISRTVIEMHKLVIKILGLKT